MVKCSASGASTETKQTLLFLKKSTVASLCSPVSQSRLLNSTASGKPSNNSKTVSSSESLFVLGEKDERQTCVLQCGRCSGSGKNGMITTRCFACGQVGDRCGDFKRPHTTDDVLAEWNDPSKVMFRCMDCERACHFDHLPEPPGSVPGRWLRSRDRAGDPALWLPAGIRTRRLPCGDRKERGPGH